MVSAEIGDDSDLIRKAGCEFVARRRRSPVVVFAHQDHQGRDRLRGIGVAISKRQVMRLLIAGQNRFLAEKRDVLRAGLPLQTAASVSVDDVGAGHASKNGFCTQLGNDDFAWFTTQPSKSRLSFLDLLRARHIDSSSTTRR